MGKCPYCGSNSIRERYREHRRYKWRCRDCNRVFRRPRRPILLWLGIGAFLVTIIGCVYLAQRGYAVSLNPDAVNPVDAQTFDSGARTPAAKMAEQIEASATRAPSSMSPQNTVLLPHLDPSLRHIDLKRAMLDMVNSERESAAVSHVVLGDNPAAQLHAEESLANCMFGHWDVHGTKPYMRYSAVGGYQGNAENSHGNRYCPRPGDNYVPVDPSVAIARAVAGWAASAGHRKTMLDPMFKKLNIGLAWSDHSVFMYHHFEGDYVDFEVLPTITSDGELSFSAATKNGLSIDEEDLYVAIHYDPPLMRLTRGQLARAHCYGSGVRVASLRRPLTDGSYWTSESTTYEQTACLDPYKVQPDASVPSSYEDVRRIRIEARAESEQIESESVPVPWITADMWDIQSQLFEISADISEVLEKHGDGIYTLMINATLNGKAEWVAEYSIFRGVEVPEVYRGWSE